MKPYVDNGHVDYKAVYDDGGSAFFCRFVNRLLQVDLVSDESELSLVGVPDQRPSPIYVKIEGNKILLEQGHEAQPLLKRSAISAARTYLKAEIDSAVDLVLQLNQSASFKGNFVRLRELIEFDDDVGAIGLGLHARMLSKLVNAVEDELSSVNFVQLSSLVTSVGSFASQYKDWLEFTKNAHEYPSKEAVDQYIDVAIDDLEKVLSSEPDTVDDKIPRSFQTIYSLLNSETRDRANAIYAGIRGFENICIASVRFLYDQVTALLKETTDQARTMAAKVAGTAIVVITLKTIGAFEAVVRLAPELQWLLDNAEKIKKIGSIISSLVK